MRAIECTTHVLTLFHCAWGQISAQPITANDRIWEQVKRQQQLLAAIVITTSN